MYAGADNDEESSDEDGDTRLSPVSMGKKVSKTSSKTPKTSTKKPEEGRKYSVAEYYEGQHPRLHPS